MHEEILSAKQKKLLPLIKTFSSEFGLIGGTAVALQLGHRRSIDFDLITFEKLNTDRIREKTVKEFEIDATMIDETNEYTIVINGVKVTFLHYPFKFDFNVRFNDYIKIPNLLTLASLKAHTLGRRAKWKDYVDLYFIFQKYSLIEVVGKAKEIFENEFNEKLFREQLSYFEDIDYSEEVDYMEGVKVEDETIKKGLIDISLQK
jgi:hypothetical protein